jgi:hypothetical protein
MDAAGIQAKINRGYGIAARYLGAPFKQYRPTDPMNPLGNLLGTVMADFDIDPAFSHKAPSKYGNPIYYGLFDATSVVPGDYLVGTDSTFAVVGMEPNKPPICISCNRTVDFIRPQPAPIGPDFYGGDQRGGGEVPLMSGWPASELQGIRGEKGPNPLPGDTRMPWTAILVPAFAGVTLEASDRMSDDIGRFWTLSSTELTNLGWRITAILADT